MHPGSRRSYGRALTCYVDSRQEILLSNLFTLAAITASCWSYWLLRSLSQIPSDSKVVRANSGVTVMGTATFSCGFGCVGFVASDLCLGATLRVRAFFILACVRRL